MYRDDGVSAGGVRADVAASAVLLAGGGALTRVKTLVVTPLVPRFPLYGTTGGTVCETSAVFHVSFCWLKGMNGSTGLGCGRPRLRLYHKKRRMAKMQASTAMIGPTITPTFVFLDDDGAAPTDCEGPGTLGPDEPLICVGQKARSAKSRLLTLDVAPQWLCHWIEKE